MTCSVYTSQSLFPATIIIAQWTHEPSSHGRKEGYAWAQQHELQPMMTDLATITAECPICQQQRSTLSPQYGPMPQGDQPASWWQVDYTGLLPSQKVKFCPYWNRHSGYRFAFTASNVSAKPTIHGLTEGLSTITILDTKLPLIKELTSQQKKCGHGLMLMEFTWQEHLFYHVPHNPKQLADRTTEWPFEDSVTVLLRRQYLAGLGQCPPRGCICSKSASNI